MLSLQCGCYVPGCRFGAVAVRATIRCDVKRPRFVLSRYVLARGRDEQEDHCRNAKPRHEGHLALCVIAPAGRKHNMAGRALEATALWAFPGETLSAAGPVPWRWFATRGGLRGTGCRGLMMRLFRGTRLECLGNSCKVRFPRAYGAKLLPRYLQPAFSWLPVFATS